MHLLKKKKKTQQHKNECVDVDGAGAQSGRVSVQICGV